MLKRTIGSDASVQESWAAFSSDQGRQCGRAVRTSDSSLEGPEFGSHSDHNMEDGNPSMKSSAMLCSPPAG